jgi:myo-inositol-1-phosphate synthase
MTESGRPRERRCGGERTGVWLIGARGSVATASVAGAAAMSAGLVPPFGCVTEQPDFPGQHLPPLPSLVFGGHDIVATPLVKRAEQLAAGGVFPQRVVGALGRELAEADAEIRSGYEPDDDPGGQASAARRLAAEIADFRDRRGLARVVVVNVSSTEPRITARPEHQRIADLEDALDRSTGVLPPSSLYAYAALIAGCPYVDFTASTGIRLPALDQLARRLRLPYAGHDAKTGQTLLQSVLAPMFAARALHVRAWSGANLLGGGDGATLADPAAAASKTASKRAGLQAMLGHQVEGAVHIDCVPTLGEWKTAWDHIAFEGLFGTPMTLQLTWHGCDSALAAPLVLDLARLTAAAHAAGAVGPLTQLGFFFKDPVAPGPDEAVEYALMAQYEQLREFAAGLGERRRA